MKRLFQNKRKHIFSRTQTINESKEIVYLPLAVNTLEYSVFFDEIKSSFLASEHCITQEVLQKFSTLPAKVSCP